jgi:phosphopantothenoylcysteine decarboxylase/phosphopantothenate--cysteine ligase
MLKGKEIVLGVSGGIAAYKAAELVRRLCQAGAKVNVIMTSAATRFISPLTLRVLSRNPVITDMFAEPAYWDMAHIALAEKAELFIIAPATANIIGKLVHGIADDALSTTVLATRAPIIIAPAMNDDMYRNPVVQENISLLRQIGFYLVEPEYGELASGKMGWGRLASLDKIIAVSKKILTSQKDFAQKTILITAGATQEPLDAVRFISNPASGKMGYALAQAALNRGAKVILISGPTHLLPPAETQFISVRTAQQMQEAVLTHRKEADIIIMAAAVSDYRPRWVSPEKIKKEAETLVLELEKTPDILVQLGKEKGKQILVGFAAETSNILENAQKKLKAKNLDLILANDITAPGVGFGTDTNQVTIITAEGEIESLPLLPKIEVANKILDKIQYIRKKKSH